MQLPDLSLQGGRRPTWQSRAGTAASDQLPLKTETAEKWGVAAVSERHVRGIQSYKGSGAPWHPPDVSLRGAKRRGNLAEPGWITWYSRRKRNCLPEIATSAVGLLAMTHQGSARCTSALTRLNCPVQGAHNPQGARRSLSKKSLRTFFAKLLSELQNQIL